MPDTGHTLRLHGGPLDGLEQHWPTGELIGELPRSGPWGCTHGTYELASVIAGQPTVVTYRWKPQ